MQQKTVIYIGALDLPDGNAAANRAWVIGKLLRDCGYQPVFIGSDRDIGAYKPILETRRVIDDCACYTNPRRDFLVSIRSIAKVIESIGPENIHAVIADNYPALPLYNLWRYCKNRHILVMADCTEWYPAGRGNLAYRVFKWLDIAFRMRYVHRKVNNIICISRFLEKYYRQRGCNTIYLPGIVDKRDPKWAIEPYQYPNRTRRFVFAGRVTNDRLEYLVAAFFELMQQGHPFEFHVFGVTKEYFLSLKPGYTAEVEALAGRVVFHGQIPHNEVLSHIKGADFTVFTRERTRVTEAGFPTKFIESFTCGIPVITNRTSDIADYLEDGKNGLLIENYDVGEIRNGLMRALAMTEQQLETMKQNCRAYDRNDYRAYITPMSKYVRELD